MATVTIDATPTSTHSATATAELTPASWVSAIIDDSPALWYRLGESSGTTAYHHPAGTSTLDATYQNVTLGVSGLVGDSDTAISLPDAGATRRVYRTGIVLSISGGSNGVGMEVVFTTTTAAGTVAHMPNQLKLSINGSGQVVATKYGDSGALHTTVTSTATVTDGGSHHAACWWSQADNRLHLVLDGVDEGDSLYFTSCGVAYSLYIGNDSSSSDQFVGVIDDWVYYRDYTADSMPLTVSTAQAHYDLLPKITSAVPADSHADVTTFTGDFGFGATGTDTHGVLANASPLMDSSEADTHAVSAGAVQDHSSSSTPTDTHAVSAKVGGDFTVAVPTVAAEVAVYGTTGTGSTVLVPVVTIDLAVDPGAATIVAAVPAVAVDVAIIVPGAASGVPAVTASLFMPETASIYSETLLGLLAPIRVPG